jgi:uncharacterized membrane protein YqgA involved in biofilm formation
MFLMIGTILNGAAILVGGTVGLTTTKQISQANQGLLKVLLGALTVYVGLSMTWSALGGGFLKILKQLLIVVLALSLGNMAGRLLRLQSLLNRLGQYAREKFTQAPNDPANRFSEGFLTCTVLFCVGPMAILGSIEDGLFGRYRTLAIKSVMDGLATMAFARAFGWGVLLSAIPVVAYQGSITMLAYALEPILRRPELLNSISATGGLLVFCVALIIFELKKIALADYLPSLVFAPILARFLGW